MMPLDILTIYSTKTVEYLVALGFLALFVPFWRYVNGRAVAGPVLRLGTATGFTSWFRVPDATYFHPAHTWARLEPDGTIVLGLDDFAQTLLGPVKRIGLPAAGTRLEQGEPAWTIACDSKAIDMIAPVGGLVTAVNARTLEHPEAVNEDPYGEGWLVRVQSPRPAAHLAPLRTGDAARRWMNEVCETLSSTLTPSLGMVLQDGGRPVDGIARAVAGDRWDELARRLLLTDAAPQLPAPAIERVVHRPACGEAGSRK